MINEVDYELIIVFVIKFIADLKDYQNLSDLMLTSTKNTRNLADCLSQFALIPNQKLRLSNLHPLAHRCRIHPIVNYFCDCVQKRTFCRDCISITC